MCSLMGLAVGGLGAQAVGLGMGVYGAIDGAMSQKKMLEAQKSVAKHNARVAEQQAQDARERGAWEKRHLAIEYAKLEGQGRSGYAASGVVLGSGSTLDWEMDMAEGYALDEKTLDHNTEMEAWGYEVAAANQYAQADMYGYAGRRAASSGIFSAVGTGISGVGGLLSGSAVVGKTFFNK